MTYGAPGVKKMSELLKEDKIISDLQAQFASLAGQARVQRARRIWVEAPPADFDAVLGALVEKYEFGNLCTITGQDEGDSFSATYHLARPDGIVLNLKVKVPKTSPVWHSICSKFPGCVNYEREIADLFEVKFEGLPPGPRYPLPDDWPEGQYPLRKDWNGNVAPDKEGGKS